MESTAAGRDSNAHRDIAQAVDTRDGWKVIRNSRVGPLQCGGQSPTCLLSPAPVPSFEQGPHSNTLNFLLTFYSAAIKRGNLYIVPSVHMLINFFW